MWDVITIRRRLMRAPNKCTHTLKLPEIRFYNICIYILRLKHSFSSLLRYGGILQWCDYYYYDRPTRCIWWNVKVYTCRCSGTFWEPKINIKLSKVEGSVVFMCVCMCGEETRFKKRNELNLLLLIQPTK